jgi:hypothetical protein
MRDMRSDSAHGKVKFRAIEATIKWPRDGAHNLAA